MGRGINTNTFGYLGLHGKERNEEADDSSDADSHENNVSVVGRGDGTGEVTEGESKHAQHDEVSRPLATQP